MSLSLGDEICTYLQGLGIGLNFNGPGTINLFSSNMPDEPEQAAACYERGGLPSVMWLTGQNALAESLIDQPILQVRVRSAMQGYVAGTTLTQSIFKALQGVTETVLNGGGALFHLIRSQQSPIYMGRDEKQRHQWSQNFFIIWDNDQRA
jgi:hypothetical protein